jgi:hypothetical protein
MTYRGGGSASVRLNFGVTLDANALCKILEQICAIVRAWAAHNFAAISARDREGIKLNTPLSSKDARQSTQRQTLSCPEEDVPTSDVSAA